MPKMRSKYFGAKYPFTCYVHAEFQTFFDGRPADLLTLSTNEREIPSWACDGKIFCIIDPTISHASQAHSGITVHTFRLPVRATEGRYNYHPSNLGFDLTF